MDGVHPYLPLLAIMVSTLIAFVDRTSTIGWHISAARIVLEVHLLAWALALDVDVYMTGCDDDGGTPAIAV